VTVVVFAGVLVAAGLFALVFGLVTMRSQVVAQPIGTTTVVTPEGEERPAPEPGSVYRVAEPLLAAAAQFGERLSPRGRRDLIQRRIIYAGREGTLRVEQIVGAKVVLGVFGLLLGIVIHIGVPWYLWSLIWAAVLFFAPDLWLDSKARNRQ
jgi:hypothetical protein